MEKDISKSAKSFIGKKLTKIVYMTDQDADDLGWDSKAIVFIFEDGSYIFPSADEEGNEAGVLFTSDPKCPVIPTQYR